MSYWRTEDGWGSTEKARGGHVPQGSGDRATSQRTKGRKARGPAGGMGGGGKKNIFNCIMLAFVDIKMHKHTLVLAD